MATYIKYLVSFIGYLGLAGAIVYCLLFPYLMRTIGKRFEKKFHKITDIYTWRIFGEKIGRFDAYIDMIINYDFYKRTNFDLYRIFKGYDFPAQLTRIELVLVKIYYYSQFFAVMGTVTWIAGEALIAIFLK